MRSAPAGLRSGVVDSVELMETETSLAGNYGPRRLNVELANICNLHCSYCFRADENLYSSHAEFFPIDLLRRVIPEARTAANVTDRKSTRLNSSHIPLS